MVNEIYQMKNEILQQAKKELNERGPERMDVDRLGGMIDMVHHLAEAEASCWQAEYYRTVTEAMKADKAGYQPMGYGMQNTGGRSGYAPGTGGTGSSAGYAPMRTSMGFQDTLDPLREAMRMASPDERERMREQLRSM